MKCEYSFIFGLPWEKEKEKKIGGKRFEVLSSFNYVELKDGALKNFFNSTNSFFNVKGKKTYKFFIQNNLLIKWERAYVNIVKAMVLT